MNYERIYFNIIENRKHNKYNGYTETHHIIPRCMGGPDQKLNLVDLSAREHYICHWLLYKMYQSDNKLSYKLLSAFMRMHCINEKTQKRYLNNRLYEVAKVKYSKNCSKNLTGKNNPNYGRIWIYNWDLDENKSILKNELPKYLKDGWIKGRYIGIITIYDSQGNKVIIKKKQINEYLDKGYIINKNTRQFHFIEMALPPEYKFILIDKKFKNKFLALGYKTRSDYKKYLKSLEAKKTLNKKLSLSHEKYEEKIEKLLPNIEDMLSSCNTLKEASDKYNYSKQMLKDAFRRKTNLPDIRMGLKHNNNKKFKHYCIICNKEFESYSKCNKYCSLECSQKGSVNNYIWISNGNIYKRVPSNELKAYVDQGFYKIKPIGFKPKEQWLKI